MGTSLETTLHDEALRYGREVEEARQRMMQAASLRHEAIFGLHAAGLSVRSIASKIGCSPSVVQNAVRQARSSRPQIERRENRVTYELHRALAEKLERDPVPVVQCGLRNVDRMLLKQRDPLSRKWVERWGELLNGPVVDLKRSMLEMSHAAEDLRQMSPFIGALTEDERLLAIKKASKNAA
jgi:transposase